jgi:broad specificity phosphatase PhoE
MRAAERPEQIAIVRHGEKPPPDGRPQGIDEDGMPHDHSLVVRGWQRAGALVNFFCVPADPTLRCPTRLYSPPRHGKAGDHGRPFETLSPLAAKLGTAIDVTYGLNEEQELANRVLARAGVVLISWEHKRIPKIANAILGDDSTAPQAWPDERFDLVWVFDRQPDGGYAFSQRPQLLLGGDRTDLIPIG